MPGALTFTLAGPEHQSISHVEIEGAFTCAAL